MAASAEPPAQHRRISRVWLASVVTFAVLAAVCVFAVTFDGTARNGCSESAATAEEAAAIAKRCGVEVEVESERTPWISSYALPNGLSRMAISAVPEQTNVNGQWEPLDLSIITGGDEAPPMSAGAGGSGIRGMNMRSDSLDFPPPPELSGMLRVAAPVFPMWFNPGGAAGADLPLGAVSVDGSWVKMWFPLPLGEATVDGRYVTYELADGARVLLAVTVDGSGFRPVIELDSPAAADWFFTAIDAAEVPSDAGVADLGIPYRFTTSAGLSLHEVGDHGFEIRTVDGESLFWSPPSLMWDSSSGIGAATTPEGAEFPLPGDVTVQMPVRVGVGDDTGGVVVIEADESLLTSPDTTWPVKIDPTLGSRTPAEWIAIRTGGFTSSIYKWTDTTTRVGESMGHCSLGWTSACGTTFTSRLVWEFRDGTGSNSLQSWMSTLSSSDITAAKFTADPGQRGNCTSTRTDVWHTDSIVEGQSNWSTLRFSTYLSNITAPQGDACSDNGSRKTWDVLTAVQSAARNNHTSISLGLKANIETSSNGYKTYKNDARLIIDYNRPPNKPTEVKLSSPVTACAAGSGRPIINTLRPTLSAKASDPDSGQQVQLRFLIVRVSDGAEMWMSSWLAAKTSGSTFTATVPAGRLAENETYRYRAEARDDEGKVSEWSTTTCEFRVDVTKPDAPVISPAPTGFAAVYNHQIAVGGPGVGGGFVISRGSGTGVTHFRYAFGDTTAWSSEQAVPSGGSITVAHIPQNAGPVTLRAQSRDAAGNWSTTTTYKFTVAPERETGIWMFDGDDEQARMPDSVPSQSPGPVLSFEKVGRVPGPHELFGSRPGDMAVSFNGIDSVATGSPTVATNTSFVVSAYVWLDPGKVGTGTYTAISQDGVNGSGFSIGHAASCGSGVSGGCWTFSMRAADTSGATTHTVRSTTPPVGGQWVHLTAAHNAETKKISLWTCNIGTPEAPSVGSPKMEEVTGPASPWRATGAFAVGRGMSGSTPGQWWHGHVDNVRVFDGQVVSVPKILRMCQGAEAETFGPEGSSPDFDALDPTAGDGQ